MQITIKNYRGIEEAELTLAPIALVGAPNGAGKTSIAQAVAAALTDRAVVLDGVNKGDAALLLRDGTKRGRCTVATPEGASTANWPGASTSAEGAAPRASDIACGLVALADMKPKDATLALIAATGATPTREQLAEAIASAELPDALVEPVWASIEADGWDAAHARAKEKGTLLKGAWEQVTGERYGAAKAATWRAEGAPDSTAGLDQLLEEQTAALEAAIAHQAVGAAEIESLQRAVKEGEAAAAEIANLEVELQASRRHEQDLAEERKALPAPQDEEASTPCPHCDKPVVIAGGELRAPSKSLSAAENKRRREKIATHSHGLGEASRRTADTNSRLVLARSKAETGKRAAARLAEIPEGGTTAEQVQAARDAVAATKRQIESATRNDQARAYAEKIEQAGKLIEILAPTGLRQVALASALEDLNTDLAEISTEAGWPLTHISHDFSVQVDGRPYVLLSESEKFRARVALQVSIAERDGSAAVIIDAADILDRKGRNGLFRILQTSELPSLVCMTFSERGEVPNLEQAGIGNTYWLGGGYAARIGG